MPLLAAACVMHANVFALASVPVRVRLPWPYAGLVPLHGLDPEGILFLAGRSAGLPADQLRLPGQYQPGIISWAT